MKNTEPIIEHNNLCYQLIDLKAKLEGIVNEPEKFRLRVKYQKKITALKAVQEEVKNLFNYIL